MPQTASPMHDRRWLILAVIGIAQLMVVLDTTIVNIALPSAQRDLGFSDDARQWVVTAYALAFGSLLLLGGRLGDLLGRKWSFVVGLLGFAAASAVGGLAPSYGVLIAARVAQGVFAAQLAPSALGLLTSIFTDPAERGRAFGIYGSIAGGGAAIGLLLGGVLTDLLSWRWCLYVNLLFAAPAAVAGLRLLVSERDPEHPPIDLVGAVLVSGGLFCLIFGFSNTETASWTDPVTVAMLAASALLLVAFVTLEARIAHPLLPLRVVADRTRGGALLAIGIAGVAMFAAFLFLTYYLQQTKGFSPIETGLAFLPMMLGVVTAANLANRVLLERLGPRPLLIAGMALGAGGMVWLAQLEATSGYALGVLPGLVLLGLGVGNIFAPAINTATYGVQRQDAGVASAMVTTMQQVGGSIGTALLSSIFASAVSDYAATHARGPRLAADAAVHGYTHAFWVAAGVFGVGLVLVGALVPSLRGDTLARQEGAVAAH